MDVCFITYLPNTFCSLKTYLFDIILVQALSPPLSLSLCGKKSTLWRKVVSPKIPSVDPGFIADSGYS